MIDNDLQQKLPLRLSQAAAMKLENVFLTY